MLYIATEAAFFHSQILWHMFDGRWRFWWIILWIYHWGSVFNVFTTRCVITFIASILFYIFIDVLTFGPCVLKFSDGVYVSFVDVCSFLVCSVCFIFFFFLPLIVIFILLFSKYLGELVALQLSHHAWEKMSIYIWKHTDVRKERKGVMENLVYHIFAVRN